MYSIQYTVLHCILNKILHYYKREPLYPTALASNRYDTAYSVTLHKEYSQSGCDVLRAFAPAASSSSAVQRAPLSASFLVRLRPEGCPAPRRFNLKRLLRRLSGRKILTHSAPPSCHSPGLLAECPTDPGALRMLQKWKCKRAHAGAFLTAVSCRVLHSV